MGIGERYDSGLAEKYAKEMGVGKSPNSGLAEKYGDNLSDYVGKTFDDQYNYNKEEVDKIDKEYAKKHGLDKGILD